MGFFEFWAYAFDGMPFLYIFAIVILGGIIIEMIPFIKKVVREYRKDWL
ncbi:MAG: hypothetical protein ACQEQF_00580 [Bacillota bacterium]